MKRPRSTRRPGRPESSPPRGEVQPRLGAATGEAGREPSLEAMFGLLMKGFAHDFNNLLNEIVGNIYLAKKQADNIADIRERLNSAERSAYLAKDLVGQLLSLSLPDTQVRSELDLSKVLPGWLDLALRGTGLSARLDIAEGLWPVRGNGGQLRQVLGHLVRNAAEAMPGGGMVTVTAANAAESAGGGAQGSCVKLTVSDEGRGIARAEISRVFDPYYSTKDSAEQRGLGLGLALCYSIVRRHGGNITVESEIGKGTSFHVYLPACRACADELPAAEGGARSLRGKVLVMDDEELDREVAEAVLKHLSYEVEVARDGEEAVELYLRAREAGEPFDVVIIDLVVPGSLGGRETLSRLREIDPGVKAVISSGYYGSGFLSELRKEGFTAVLPKPYRVEELRRVIGDFSHNSDK